VHAPGYRREGVKFFDHNGAGITGPDVLARITSLAIPPAWTDVWISPDPAGSERYAHQDHAYGVASLERVLAEHHPA
jgi:DNA topoisomerase IB